MCINLFSILFSKHTGAVEAYTPNVLERHMFGVFDRSLSAASIKDELRGRGEQTSGMNLFFVDWMRAEDQPNMLSFFFGSYSTFGTYFTKQFHIKIKHNTHIKEMTVMFNYGFRVLSLYLSPTQFVLQQNSNAMERPENVNRSDEILCSIFIAADVGSWQSINQYAASPRIVSALATTDLAIAIPP